MNERAELERQARVTVAAIEEAADGRRWALAGALALHAYEVGGPVTEVTVVALEPLAPPLPPGATTDDTDCLWTPDGGLPVRWTTRDNHYATLWWRSLQDVAGEPPVVGALALLALLLVRRDQAEGVIGLLAEGVVDADEARAFVLEHLGPFALDTLNDLLLHAEWELMKRRHTRGGDVH